MVDLRESVPLKGIIYAQNKLFTLEHMRTSGVSCSF